MPTDETAGQSTGAPATASTPAKPEIDLEAVRKQAKAEGWREAQSRFDRERAALLKREADARAAAAARMKELGDERPDDWEKRLADMQDAEEMRRLREEARQAREWERHVEEVAKAWGLEKDDPRLRGAESAADLASKAKAAMQADAEEARKGALKAKAEAEQQKLQAAADAGELDVLGGGDATPLSQAQRVEQAHTQLKKLLNTPGRKDVKKIEELKAIVRAG